MEILLLIERLLRFGVQHKLITELDVYVARNALLDLFGEAEPYSGAVPEETLETPTEILEALCDAGAQKQLFDNEVYQLRVNFEARIMGTIMPRESEVAAQFHHLWSTQGVQAATDYFYSLCIACNYIRTAQIAKNIGWTYPSRYGDLEITINLTKPEKDPKTIAMERLAPAASYPKCMLCIENIGYAGRVNFPARQNHRVVPFSLCGEEWYLQYSPYVYYNEHCIIFSKKHEPMSITPRTIAQIFDFVRQFPHYTCGSNADLPIVGGSILSHTHFQGGRYTFPMQKAQPLHTYKSALYPNIKLQSIRWPVSTLRVTGNDVQQMQAFAEHALAVWRGYSDETADVLAYTQENGEAVPHNTITPILHKNGEGAYVLDLVPRNNRTSAAYPDGIFHPHQEIHHIKKENIGLIEVMGLAILPARLQQQSAAVQQVLCGKLNAETAKADMPVHAQWIDALTQKYGTAMAPQQAQQAVKGEIGAKFTTCLEHAGVFKQTPDGEKAFDRFMAALGCTKE